MNTKKITLSFIAITFLLALVQFSITPLALASDPLPNSIEGIVFASQGKEAPYSGTFSIFDFQNVEESSGLFNAFLSYHVEGGPQTEPITIENAPITGIYKTSRDGSLNIQFTGDDISIRGQMKQDARYGNAFVGFINNPGHGYNSQVFVIEYDLQSLP